MHESAPANLRGGLLGSACAFSQTFSGSAALDASTEQAIKDGLIPGAVIVVGHDGQIVHRKAYGSRAIVPSREPATVDTIYDVASLTKVIATTPAIMKLFEQGKLRPDDPRDGVCPRSSGRQKSHHGSRPDDAFFRTAARPGSRSALERLPDRHPEGLDRQAHRPSRTRSSFTAIFRFELLGEIVRRLSGEPLDQFTHEQIYEPLGMKDATNRPAASLSSPHRADRDRQPPPGTVSRSSYTIPLRDLWEASQEHVGLFSTADDLARYAEMMLGMGLARRSKSFRSADRNRVYVAGIASQVEP